jgi:hypothetical protein
LFGNHFKAKENLKMKNAIFAMRPICLVLTLALGSGVAQAKTKKTATVAPAPIEAPVAVESPILSDATYQALLKQSKEGTRRIAQTATDVPAIEAKFSADFLSLRDDLLGNGKDKAGINSVKDLDAQIKKYSDPNVYNKLSTQAQFVALQLRALAPMKSSIFRLKEYVRKYDAIRVYIVSLLRAQIAGIQMFFPVAAPGVSGAANVNRWEVVFKYITEPADDMAYPITDDAHLYAYLTSLANATGLINNDFAKLVDKVNKGDNVWWDNKLFMSFASFTSDKDRYTLLGAPEMNSLFATTSLSLSCLDSMTAYSLDGLQDSIRDIGRLFGIQNVLNGPDGMSSLSRTAVLKMHPALFTKVADGDQRLAISYDLLVTAARHAKLSFEQSKLLKSGSDNLFDPGIALGFNRIGSTALANIDDLLQGKGAESTVVNGEKINVDLKGFYTHAPARLSDLYPQTWVMGPEYYSVQAWGKPDTLRNYKYGMATSWNYQAYKTLFPDITSDDGGKTTKDISKYVRVLSQTWGAAAFALPLGAVIF